MAEHNLLGKAGEDAAVDYLERHDYVIRHRNWRKGHFELDIVAAKNGELIIVEVKTRSDTDFALPQDAVTPQNIRLFQIDEPVRFDIITVIGKIGNFRIEHIKEAFYPPLF